MPGLGDLASYPQGCQGGDGRPLLVSPLCLASEPLSSERWRRAGTAMRTPKPGLGLWMGEDKPPASWGGDEGRGGTKHT